MVEITLGVLFIAASLIYLVWPLLSSKEADVTDAVVLSARDRQELLDRKASLLAAIKDIEFDYRLGKMSEEDYAELVEQYKQQAEEALGRLDDQDETEALIAKARQRIQGEKDSGAEDERACPSCATPNPLEARFCMNCGAELVKV